MRSNSPARNRAIGQQLAEKLQAGDVLLMLGDLGAGKSELTRGIAKGLGVTATVASPSFTILNVYDEGRGGGGVADPMPGGHSGELSGSEDYPHQRNGAGDHPDPLRRLPHHDPGGE